mmetsp:Transcript_5697/g.21509  ORF Transcript_5697/g.21509 Transcript_5697/m.21509 type:complete len:83 (-) Transcript_5697:887-1135(-)
MNHCRCLMQAACCAPSDQCRNRIQLHDCDQGLSVRSCVSGSGGLSPFATQRSPCPLSTHFSNTVSSISNGNSLQAYLLFLSS